MRTSSRPTSDVPGWGAAQRPAPAPPATAQQVRGRPVRLPAAGVRDLRGVPALPAGAGRPDLAVRVGRARVATFGAWRTMPTWSPTSSCVRPSPTPWSSSFLRGHTVRVGLVLGADRRPRHAKASGSSAVSCSCRRSSRGRRRHRLAPDLRPDGALNTHFAASAWSRRPALARGLPPDPARRRLRRHLGGHRAGTVLFMAGIPSPARALRGRTGSTAPARSQFFAVTLPSVRGEIAWP